MPTRRPTFTLTYQGVDITEDLTPLTLSLSYTDKLEGESDELAIALINSDLRWLNAWLPGEGDVATLTLGYEGEAPLGPVSFEVDSPEWSGPPDQFMLKGLGTPISKSLRQRNTQAYEGTTLLAIASTIAEKHGLEVVGSDNIPSISFERVTQKEIDDLSFLRQLSAEYGLLFKVESLSKLVFFREIDLESGDPVLPLSRADLSGYRLRRQAAGTYEAARVSYQNPSSGQFISVTINTDGAEVTPSDDEEGSIGTTDILVIRERCEDLGQAQLKATEALRRANSTRVEFEASLEGNPLLSAGIIFDLSGFQRFDGRYLISQVTHRLDRSRGYRSNVRARKV